jgi:hypothetical protein
MNRENIDFRPPKCENWNAEVPTPTLEQAIEVLTRKKHEIEDLISYNKLTNYEMLLIRACKSGEFKRLEKLYKNYHLINIKGDALNEGICYDLEKITNKFKILGSEFMIFEISKAFRFSKELPNGGTKFNPVSCMLDILINRIRFESPNTFGKEMIWPSKYKQGETE